MSWGARAADWLANEEQHRPIYEEAIARVGLPAGARVLDVGCGAGVFLGLASARGAAPHGVDSAPELLALARDRVPAADLREAEMESLPFAADEFDLVTGFTSFFLCPDIVAALREAGRVARPGAPVFIQAWGDPDRCQLEAMKAIARQYAPPPPADAPSRPPLWEPGTLERIAAEAGLVPERAFDFSFAYEYENDETLGRLLLAPMGLGELVGPDREPAVRDQIVEAMAPYRSAIGAYRIENEYRCLIARAS